MFRLRLLHKLFIGNLLAILVAMAITWVLIEQQLLRDLNARVRDDLEHQLMTVVQLVGDCFQDDAAATRSWRQRLHAIGLRTPQRVTLIAADGRVIADSDEEAIDMDNHAGRPELVASRTAPNNLAESRRYSKTLGQELLYSAYAVRDEAGTLRGWVRLSVPLEFLDQQRWQLRISVSVGVAVAGVVAVLLGSFVARGLVRPLEQLSQAASGLAAGERNWNRPLVGVSRERGDEIGALVTSFEGMATELDNRFQTITADRNKLIAVLEGMHEGVLACDAEGRIVHINDAARDLLGIVGEVTGEMVVAVCPYEGVWRSLERSMADDGARDCELQAGAAGRKRSLILRCQALTDAVQRTVGAVMVVTDQTERRRLDDMRRDFVANVSHELKTPLTVIQGILETITDDDGMPAAMRSRFTAKAQDHTRRLSNLVTDLLTLSRLESHADHGDREHFDLRSPLRAAVGTLRETARSGGITIEGVFGDQPLMVEGDAEAIQQVVDNLLSNAVRYSPPHTTVRVAAQTDGRTVSFSISDEGIGIPQTAQSRIFERFYRVDKARSRELGGTGLGLSIVKHVVLAHGGTVEVDSEVGQGSVFTVILPAV